jgi:uncharacterized protein (DUF433 family)
METDLLERVEVNPKIMFGKPVIKGTRLTVELILEKLAQGYTHDKLIGEYPFLTEEGIRASLLYAAKTLSVSEIV